MKFGFKKLVIATTLCIVMCGSVITENVKAAASEKDVNTFRIGTFNIAANKNPDLRALAALVDEQDIDVVGLQEVDRNTERNARDMLQEFIDGGNMEYGAYQKTIDFEGGEYGIGIASKIELTDIGGSQLYSEGLSEARAYGRAVVTVDNKKVAVYNTHLSWEEDVATAVKARKNQMEELKQKIETDPIPYKVIVGDFNADQSHSEWYTFLEGLNMANGGEGKWYDTYNGVDPTMLTMDIDNIITTRNIKLSNITMVETKLSDHNLFYADLTLLDNEQPSKQLLNLLLEDAEIIDKANYSSESYDALQLAVDNAKSLASDASQTEIDGTVKALQDAMQKLQQSESKESDTDKIKLIEQAIDFAVSSEKTNGSTFFSDSPINRAMLVTVLYYLEGSPNVKQEISFEDVEDGQYYVNAVNWATANDIVKGTEKGFEPKSLITREQLALILYRYSGNNNSENIDVSNFIDSNKVSDWAVNAMYWAVQEDIIRNKETNKLNPSGNVTCSELEDILNQYVAR